MVNEYTIINGNNRTYAYQECQLPDYCNKYGYLLSTKLLKVRTFKYNLQ